MSNDKKQPTPAPSETRNAAGELTGGQVPAPSTPAPAVEPMVVDEPKPTKSKAKFEARGTVPEGKKDQQNDARVQAPKSGGPRSQPAVGEAVVDLQGNTPSHPPDLADNSAGGPVWPKSGVRADPMDMAQMSDAIAFDQISRETFANVLYKWRRDERASDTPRAEVISAIEARLLHVQGPPIPRD